MIRNFFDNSKNYTSAMILGLHDALVEFIGMIIGLSLVLADSRLVILTTVIAGVSASLSMGSSNYLAEKANENPDAVKAGIYTGIAYLITVALLVIPFIILPDTRLMEALGLMIIIAILIIFVFNYYISRIKAQSFKKNFSRMLAICVTVSLVAFGIGQVARLFLGVDF